MLFSFFRGLLGVNGGIGGVDAFGLRAFCRYVLQLRRSQILYLLSVPILTTRSVYKVMEW